MNYCYSSVQNQLLLIFIYNTARIHEHGLYTYSYYYSNHYSTQEAYIQKRPYSQVNLDRMALQLALTKAKPRRLYIPKMVLDLGWFSLVER